MFSGCWRVDCPGSTVRLAVSRSLGDATLKLPIEAVIAVPEVSSVRITPADDFFILASDGLWDVMDNARAVREVQQCWAKALNSPPQNGMTLAKQCADSLVHAAILLGADDNVTVVIVMLFWRKSTL